MAQDSDLVPLFLNRQEPLKYQNNIENFRKFSWLLKAQIWKLAPEKGTPKHFLNL